MRMKQQRFEYDEIHRKVLSSQLELDQLKKQLVISKHEEYMVDDTNYRKTTGMKNGEDSFNQIREEFDFEIMT